MKWPAGSLEDSEPQGALDLEKDKLKMLIEVEMLKDASRYVNNCFDIKDFEQAKDFDSVKLTPTWRQEQDQRCWRPLGEEDVEQEEEVDNCLKTKDEKTWRIGFWQLLDNLTIAWGPRMKKQEK